MLLLIFSHLNSLCMKSFDLTRSDKFKIGWQNPQAKHAMAPLGIAVFLTVVTGLMVYFDEMNKSDEPLIVTFIAIGVIVCGFSVGEWH